jgi:hypothetical protein
MLSLRKISQGRNEQDVCSLSCLLRSGLLLGLLFDPEDGASVSLRIVGGLLLDYTGSHPTG